MEGTSAKKSTSLETLVIQTISNVNDLKSKLSEIIKTGKDYEFDVSSCIKSLLISSDQEIVLLSVQAISELAKCEEKRETYAQKDIIEPILKILQNEVTTDRLEIVKQSCRALGNLCCDCDISRKVIIDCDGVSTIKKVIEKSFNNYNEITLLGCKTLLNFSIGGLEFCEAIIEVNILDIVHKILKSETEKVDPDDDMLSTILLLMSVINDNLPEFLFSDEINKDVLKVLQETANMEISELCLDHLHAQAEHDSVKTLLANEGGVELVCSRLEQLISRHEAGELSADDTEIDAVIKQACDLIVIVLTGDEAMHALYAGGDGAVYRAAVRWLRARSAALVGAAVLAVGNFARNDRYCEQMMRGKIYDQLLDIFERYHRVSVSAEDAAGATRVVQGACAALRNLSVAAANKRAASDAGAPAALLAALPAARDPLVAYKLLATLRMLLHTQPHVAAMLAADRAALAAAARWGLAGEGAGAAGEGPRLLAWCVRELRAEPLCRALLEVEGCISCLVNMLLASHSLMQNEAILALTLLARLCLVATPDATTPNVPTLDATVPDVTTPNTITPDIITPDATTPDVQPFDYERGYSAQLVGAEIGKHVAVLVDTNCAKMPVEVAENLIAFLHITSRKNEISADYRQEKVHESLQKFADSRSDLNANMSTCLVEIIKTISGGD